MQLKQYKVSYSDEEALELATAIVESYVTMRTAGAEPTSPIMDIYFNYGKETN